KAMIGEVRQQYFADHMLGACIRFGDGRTVELQLDRYIGAEQRRDDIACGLRGLNGGAQFARLEWSSGHGFSQARRPRSAGQSNAGPGSDLRPGAMSLCPTTRVAASAG